MDHYSVRFTFCCQQTIVGCAIIIADNEGPIEADNVMSPRHNSTALASLPLWPSLGHLQDLRALIVGTPDINAVKVLLDTHQELWESLGRKLDYHRFASQPVAGVIEQWVGHDSVSLEQTGTFGLPVSLSFLT